MSKSDNVRIDARIPASLKELMRKFVELDSHMSQSEFIRDSIREKIQHEAPGLYAQLFNVSDKPIESANTMGEQSLSQGHVCGECDFWSGGCRKNHVNKLAGDAACSDFKERG